MLLLFILILINNCVNSFIPPNLINPLVAGSQLVIAKKGKEYLEESKLDVNTTRKIIHITTAPTFLSSLQFYNDYQPKLWATSVPLIASLFLIYKGDNLAKVISRSGSSKEILKGPLIYTFILTLLTYYYWLDNPTGIIAMTQLSVGDGFADIIGRKFGKTKWPYNTKKSVEGTFGYFITSSLATYFLVDYVYQFNYPLFEIILISFISSLVETFSKIDDNISIPLSVIVSCYLFK